MELSFSLQQKKTDRSLLPKSSITRVMSVLERRSGMRAFRFCEGLFLQRAAAFLMRLCDRK